MNSKQIVTKSHIMVKPEAYIGSMQQVTEQVWIFKENKMVLKKVAYIPALLKFYEDLLITAAENRMKQDSTSVIQVNFRQNGYISVTFDGEMPYLQKTYDQKYVLESILDENKLPKEFAKVSNRCKLINLFSKFFCVECGSFSNKCALKIEWIDKAEPKLRILSYNKKDYFRMGYRIDFQLFNIQAYSQDFMGLMERRAYDIAGLLRVKLTINNKQVSFDSLTDYAQLFVKDPSYLLCDSSQQCPRWNVIIGKTEHNSFQQLSFVNNSIWTKNGGTHVDLAIAQIANRALEAHKKKLKNPEQAFLKSQKYKSNYFLMVSIFVEEPQFTSPIKDVLTSPISAFGSLYKLTEHGLAFLQKNRLLQTFKNMVKQRDVHKATKKQSKKRPVRSRLSLPKLEDAYYALASTRCTLIIVEGDGIKSLVMSGLQCVNKDYFGVYALKGKIFNTRDATVKQITDSQDLNGLVKSIGLAFNTNYDSAESLRYSSILIMADHDHEGSAMRGLVLNFIQTFWPSLCRLKGFIKFLYPPTVKCSHSNGQKKQFSTQIEYNTWSNVNTVEQWSIKYYKNLGSISQSQMRQLIADRQKLSYSIVYQTQQDEEALKLVYSKKNIQIRKRWLEDYRPEASWDHNTNLLSIKDFVHKQLIHSCYTENQKLIASVIDGLKTVERKALQCMFSLGIDKQIKITQLVGKVQNNSNSQFTESIIINNILSLAHNYIGSNNICILQSIGQFGTRHMAGKDSAPVRSLSTCIDKLTILLFPEDDQYILQYGQEVGISIEPKFYAPILPLGIINGSDSVGSFWNSTVYCHKVSEVIDMVKDRIANKAPKFIGPSWDGYRGTVNMEKKGFYIVRGNLQIKSKSVVVTEIPITKSIKQYKSFLEEHLPSDKGQGQIEDIREEHKGNNVRFIVKFQQGKTPPQAELQRYFNLTCNLKEHNLTLINQHSRFKRYETIHDMFEEYFQVRLKFYEKRKQYLVSKYTRIIQELMEKIRFIKDVLNQQFLLSQSQAEWKERFSKKGYKKYQQFCKIKTTKKVREDNCLKDYDHFYKIQMNQFTELRIRQLKSERQDCQLALTSLKKQDQKQLWLRDISYFQDAWKKNNKRKDEQLVEGNKRLQSLYRDQLSQASLLKTNKNDNQLSEQISLNSRQRADLQRQKTDQISQEQKVAVQPRKSIMNGIYKPNNIKMEIPKQQITQSEYIPGGKSFSQQLIQMERENLQFQEHLRIERDMQKRKDVQQRLKEKERERELQKRKKEEQRKEKQQEERRNKNVEDGNKIEKNIKNQKLTKQQAIKRRQELSKHAQQIGKKVEQDMRRQRQEREKSSASERKHIAPPAQPIPSMTVPYQYTGFTVSHVQRKRFSSRNYKHDQQQIQDIQASIKRDDEKVEKRKHEKENIQQAIINIDDDE